MTDGSDDMTISERIRYWLAILNPTRIWKWLTSHGKEDF